MTKETSDILPWYGRLLRCPDETVIDGELVALDESGRPSFNTLQNYGWAKAPVFYYVFDVLIRGGRNVMSEPLSVRRELLRQRVLPKLGEHSPFSRTGCRSP